MDVMAGDHLPDFVEYLLTPEAYSYPVTDIKLIQTHISYIILAGDFVYKFKKPMNFGFLDFTSLAKRKYFCQQELILNRRLCPTVYLGLVSVNRAASGILALNGSGEAVEYGVKMIRMPEEAMMGNIIKAGKLSFGMIDGLIAVLESFYENAASGTEIERHGTAQSVSANVLGNLVQSRKYIGCESLSQDEYDKIGSYVQDFLADTEIFNRRIVGGRIRDCHGDLHSGNICLTETVYIYDCIEFNHRFRYIDVASDVAFLAMDLDYYHLDEVSDYFIHQFVQASGDVDLPLVLNFYKCYRAAVRGKIGLLTAHEPEVDEKTRSEALVQATRYFMLAQSYAERK